jgi:hypothetical protein
MEPLLDCPTFLGDPNGTLADTKERVRTVRKRVDNVEDRVAALEAENARLQEQLEAARVQIDATALVEWLSEMVARSVEARLPTVPVQIAGQTTRMLPEPVADMIISVGALDAEVLEAVPVAARERPGLKLQEDE